MPFSVTDEDTGISRNQEPEDKKLLCVDQKLVTASQAFHQTMTTA